MSSTVIDVDRIGIWVEGVDRLGVLYEGVWRVIKQFLLASAGTSKTFLFVAPARFASEIDGFLHDLPDDIRNRVNVDGFGDGNNSHDSSEAMRQALYADDLNVDAWLIPNPMWSASKFLKKPKLVWFHDFLLSEFPQSYPRKLFTAFERNVEDLKMAGSFFLFTSPHVWRHHGQEHCGISRDQSTLVLNPCFDAAGLLRDIPDDPRHGGDLIRAELRKNLRQWCSNEHADLFYHHISSYPFESVPYFFVSSQNREHKGFLRLAQIYATMLREQYLPYSVFTTALVDVKGESPLEKFLKQDLLMGDFMSVGKVSDQTLALLFKFARLTIHPSTFEGNLPLPFAESVSVGTPCIMPYSRAYTELVDSAMHPWVFYSPTEAGLIAKVGEVEEHREEFLAAQREVLKSLQRYSLSDYFRAQMDAFGKATKQKPIAASYLVKKRPDAAPEKGLLQKSLDLFRPSSEEASEDVQCVIEGRVWPDFALKTALDKGSAGAPALHWATYLEDDFPTGGSYFLIDVEGLTAGSKEVTGLIAESGGWIKGDYVIEDRKLFQFSALDSLPEDLRDALFHGTLEPRFASPDRPIGWARLSCGAGADPELRVAGIDLPPATSARAKLACVSTISLSLQTDRKSGCAKKSSDA